MSTTKRFIPADGLAGLKQHFSKDALSGFLVFLLALPLSLGIAKASDFPAVFGLVTAIIGGVIVSFFAGSRLTIKGPAAGLIVIVSGSVAAFGGDVSGWHLALGAIVVAGIIQIIFGALKLGNLADFFPVAAIHGMLAAIGIIIMSKQLHLLLGIDPGTLKGKDPLELLAMLPHSILSPNGTIAILGLICLGILIVMSMIKNKVVKRIPAPLIVLVVAIPLGIIMHLGTVSTASFVKVGNVFDNFKEGLINADFSGLTSHTGVFIQYVILFSLIGTIESLLTAKAIDGMDPFKRKSNFNQDVIAVGVGNSISGLLGGLPMISEVARSSANVANGAVTRWANFFHGLFLLLAVLVAVPVIEMIPNTALAAMLTFVGFRLTHPREYVHIWKVGKEQFVVFVVTVIVTLSTDLLIGVGSGIVLNLIFILIRGHKPGNLFRVKATEKGAILELEGELSFSNYLGLKKRLVKHANAPLLTLDFQQVNYIDHNVMGLLLDMKEDWKFEGKNLEFLHLQQLVPSSEHPASERKRGGSFEVVLSKRDFELKAFATAKDWGYNPGTIPGDNYRNFNLLSNLTIEKAENVIQVSPTIQVADITGIERVDLGGGETALTAVLITVSGFPSFTLSALNFIDQIQDAVLKSDITIEGHPAFTSQYKLLSNDEAATRTFFNEQRITLLEGEKKYELEVNGSRMLVVSGDRILSPAEIAAMVDFAQRFVEFS